MATINLTNYDDVYTDGVGSDIINGRNGNDTIHGGDGNDFIDGGAGSDSLYGDAGDDILKGRTESDHLFGGIGNDNMDGNAGDDFLFGGDGVDTLVGDLGDDWLQGDAGNDYLQGEEGRDRMIGGTGDDVMKGGRDADTFVFDFALKSVTTTTTSTIQAELTGFNLKHPNANADWKAWENYENKLIDFFEKGGLEDAAAKGKFTGDVNAFKAEWDAYKASLTTNSGFAKVQVITDKKAANTNGNDTANHDIDNNLQLYSKLSPAADQGQTTSAAFYLFRDLGGKFTQTVTTTTTSTTLTGADGNDQILDYSFADDSLEFHTGQALSVAQFDQFFSITQVDANNDGVEDVVVTLKSGGFSVTLLGVGAAFGNDAVGSAALHDAIYGDIVWL